ncbi:MAG: hypothetical protein PQJ46_17485, partial [Spirochaetales bacterium]|nr:hypothetical protein [Spirochaetales bacterium]
MQKALFLPLKFIAFFFLAVIIMLFFCMIQYWTNSFSPTGENSIKLLQRLPDALSIIIFPATSIALLMAFFHYRKRSSGIAAVTITGILIFLVIFFGYKVTSLFNTDSASTYPKPFAKQTIHITDDYIIYTDNVSTTIDGSELAEGVMVKDRNNSSDSFKYYPNAKLSKQDKPELLIDKNQKIDIAPANPVFFTSFYPGKFLENIINNTR